MKCRNCDGTATTLRLAVPVCVSCAGVVDRALLRAEKEARMLVVVFKETIRLQLISGKLHPQEAQEAVGVKDVLERILQMKGEA